MEPEAWRRFFLRHRRLVRGVLATCVGYTAELEDLTQQVFVTAASLVRSGRVSLRGDEGGLRAWVAAIAVRVGYAEQRRRRTSGLVLASEATPGPSDLDPEARQVLEHACSVWERLPGRLRVPWLLRHLERFTVAKIASVLGISPATVKRRLRLADSQFRALANADPVLREYLGTAGAA